MIQTFSIMSRVFYETLYTCKYSDLLYINLEDIIKTSDIPTLDKTATNSLNETISDSEIYTVLENSKSPLSQGFVRTVKSTLYRLSIIFSRKKELSTSQRLIVER